MSKDGPASHKKKVDDKNKGKEVVKIVGIPSGNWMALQKVRKIPGLGLTNKHSMLITQPLHHRAETRLNNINGIKFKTQKQAIS